MKNNLSKNNIDQEKLESFLNNLTHEVRTSLNAIIGFSQVLYEKTAEFENSKQYLEIIKHNGYSLLDLVNNLTALSLIELGFDRLNISEFKIQGLYDKLKEDINTLVSENERELLDLNFYVSPCNNEIVKSDFNKIYKVLFNIVKNAVNYANNSSIEIGCEKIKSGTILFYVKDSGIGIDLQQHDIIFEKFSKLENNGTKGRTKGLGIGLSICKSFIEELGGEIWIDSNMGEGSSFYFTILTDMHLSKKIPIKNINLN